MDRSKLRIGMVTWPLNDVGGINSWAKNFMVGIRALGHYIDLFYATPQTRFGCHPTEEITKSRYTLLAATHLSYRAEFLKLTLETLNSYDLLFMLHPSPHPTRAVKAKPGYANWTELYRGVQCPIVVVFHDANWQKTNSWFSEVSEHVGAALAAQKLFLPSVMDYPSDCPKSWEYFPLNLDMAHRVRQPTRKVRVVLGTQWLKWKNHHKLLPHLLKIRCPVELYGNGQEYYTLRNNGVLPRAVRLDKTQNKNYNKRSKHTFHGFVPYDELLTALGSSLASIDLSTKGYTNMTHWEPLTTGTVSLIERRVVNHPDNQIPPDCCVAYDLDSAAEDINRLITDKILIERVVQAADKFIPVCGCARVARRILTWLAKNRVIK